MLLLRLWPHILVRRRYQLAAWAFLMIFASAVEIISLSSVLPFIGALISPEKIFYNETLHPIFIALGLVNPESVKLPLTIVFCVSAIVAGLLRMLLIWVTARLSHAIGADVGYKMLDRTLGEPFVEHINRNSSFIVSAIVSKANTVVMVAIGPMLNIISAATIFIGIGTTLIFIEPVMTLYVLVALTVFYFFVGFSLQWRLEKYSIVVARNLSAVTKLLKEALGAINEVIIYKKKSYFTSAFQNIDGPLRRAQGNVTFIASSPRYAVEALVMVFVAISSFILFSSQDNALELLPVIALLLLAGQKILPLMQLIYGSFANFVGGAQSLEDAIKMMEIPSNDVMGSSKTSLHFKDSIDLCDVSFAYEGRREYSLRNVHLKIKKGECIGFIGKTGGGKTTLINIILGLLEPTSGHLEVDGKMIGRYEVAGWQKNLAYVPQNVFLSDASIRSNVAFGEKLDHIDNDLVYKVLESVKLDDLVSSFPDGIDTVVGENAVKLSGGQRQRLGIARALYQKANVMVLDEASSALDNMTEIEVMSTINALKGEKTIIMIAHRYSTLRLCDRIIELDEGRIGRVGTYSEVIGND